MSGTVTEHDDRQDTALGPAEVRHRSPASPDVYRCPPLTAFTGSSSSIIILRHNLTHLALTVPARPDSATSTRTGH
jgi:hypothetical protein